MSDQPPMPPSSSGTPPEGSMIPGGGRVWGQRRASASVSLRAESGEQTLGSMLDPATQSLADALRITYRLLQFAMIVLVGLFFLSGAQSVKEGERGIRLVFGRVVDAEVAPGFRLSWPRPIGELVKVTTSPQTVRIDRSFFPELSAAEEQLLEKEGSQKLAGGGRQTLNPEVDGSNLTADGSIAHTRWEVKYIREDARLVEEHVHAEDELDIVKAAVRRGVVHAISDRSIDAVIKGDFASVAEDARLIAQETLNSLGGDGGCGLRISQLTLTTAIAPRGVMADFNKVETARSAANTALEAANQERTKRLNDAAGPAATLLLDRINAYEMHLAAGHQADAEQTLAVIDDLLMGRETTIDGTTVHPAVFGEVSSILNDAREYTTSIVNRAASELALFKVKQDSLKANPLVLVNGDWTEAMLSLLENPNVTLMSMPADITNLMLELNRDPQIARKQEMDRNKAEGEKSLLDRQKMLERRRRGG